MIVLEKLSCRFTERRLTSRTPANEVLAVDNVSLTVEEGEMLVLLGGSGSGKTTTLKMVNRLIEPSSGRVLLDGQDVSEFEPHLLRRRIGYCFQQIGLFPHMTVAENIGITPKLLGWSPEQIGSRINEMLDMVELVPDEFRDRMPEQLSGGQKQRVGVARAMAAKPRVILFDEPFGALDPLTRDKLQQSIQRIRKKQNLTSFVTHDMVEALILADRIAVMNEGKLVQIGTPQELLSRPADDYVAQLMATPTQQADAIEDLLEQARRMESGS
ncbi:MAG: ABC transporter ATP-binding protein [Myxococcales bacterium]|nr:MAG: ABC transporter ATP-binding protein [Myxococcales bacterium]